MNYDWFCHQLGSREHYSIPRALHGKGCLALLQTDAWVSPGTGCMLPEVGPLRSLGGRYHPDLQDARVRSFTLGRLWFDALSRLRRDKPWDAIIKRNTWYQGRCLPALRRSLTEAGARKIQPTVFSFSYTARELFREAKRHGARCVLGQIDPGPEEIRWVEERCGGKGSIEAPPPAYWDSWREEVELADDIIANSEWSRKLLVRGGVPEDKIHVIPLAYERPASAENSPPRHYPPEFSATRKLKVLFLGQVIARKGMREAFDALPLLADAPVEFHIAGPLGLAVPDAVKRHPHVHFHGPVAQAQARQLYRDCDVFILPTHSDGFAITQLEAAAHHLPIIASPFCASIVEPGMNGLLLDDVTPIDIARAIRTCVESPGSLAQWAAHDLDWKNHSIRTLGERLLRLRRDPTPGRA